jgi:hypothetical protein
MSDKLCTNRYNLSADVFVLVEEYADHPARLNSNIRNLFCADGWWRIECRKFINGCPTIFATIIMVRVFDEKWHNQYIHKTDRLCILCIPVEGYFHGVSIMNSGSALTVQFSPNEQSILGYLGLEVPGTRSAR